MPAWTWSSGMIGSAARATGARTKARNTARATVLDGTQGAQDYPPRDDRFRAFVGRHPAPHPRPDGAAVRRARARAHRRRRRRRRDPPALRARRATDRDRRRLRPGHGAGGGRRSRPRRRRAARGAADRRSTWPGRSTAWPPRPERPHRTAMPRSRPAPRPSASTPRRPPPAPRSPRRGADLLADAGTILTHCNTGALATGGRGSALAVILALAEAKPALRVLATETRPLLQGARLTTWELRGAGVAHELVVDGAAPRPDRARRGRRRDHRLRPRRRQRRRRQQGRHLPPGAGGAGGGDPVRRRRADVVDRSGHGQRRRRRHRGARGRRGPSGRRRRADRSPTRRCATRRSTSRRPR